MREKGWNQAALAKAVKRSEATVSRWLGKPSPSWDFVIRVCAALEIAPPVLTMASQHVLDLEALAASDAARYQAIVTLIPSSRRQK